MKKRNPARPLLIAAALVAGLLLALPSLAQFRSFTPIASPDREALKLPSGAVPVEQVEPVPREVVEPKLREIFEKWNTAQMGETLSEKFFDKDRLLDTMNTQVPRDAKLRFQSLQRVQTLQQYRVPTPVPLLSERVSLVSATARTQVEFNSDTGLVVLPGTNEYILEVRQPEFGTP